MEKTISHKKMLKKWKIKLSIIGLIGIISFILCIFLSMDIIKQYKFNQSIKTSTKSILKDKSDGLYYLDFKGSMISDKDYNNYLYNLNNIEDIKYSGAFCTSSIYIKELQNNKEFVTKNKEIRKNNTSNILKNSLEDNHLQSIYKYTDTLIVSSGLFDFMDLKIYKGESYELYKSKSNNEIPILIGYNYKDVVDIGQTIVGSPNDTTYKVIGILKKYSSWIDENNLANVGNHTNTSINLDNYFVIVYDNKHFKDNETVILSNPTTYVYTDNKDSLSKINDLNKE